MVFNEELGKEIPKGWEVKKISDISDEVTRGFTTSYVEKSNLINLNQKVNRGSYLDKSNFKYYPGETEVSKNKFAHKGDLLINSLGQGTLGRVHLYLEDTQNVVVDQHITIVRVDSERINSYYLYYYLPYCENQARIESSITGSTGMLMLNISKIRDFEVMLPDIKTLNSFKSVVSYLNEKRVHNVLNIESLTKIRDSLLPKLMSGKIRVPVEVE